MRRHCLLWTWPRFSGMLPQGPAASFDAEEASKYCKQAGRWRQCMAAPVLFATLLRHACCCAGRPD